MPHMLTDVLTFQPSVSTTWDNNHNNENWLTAQNVATYWHAGDIANFDASTANITTVGTIAASVSNAYGTPAVAGITFASGSWNVMGSAISLFNSDNSNYIKVQSAGAWRIIRWSGTRSPHRSFPLTAAA